MTDRQWNAFSRSDPSYYILTTLEGRADYSHEEFFASGEEFTRGTLARVDHILPSWRKALEIGCGIGRLTLPHARVFDAVVAVDVAREMLSGLSMEAEAQGIGNVIPVHAAHVAQHIEQESIDYAYSFLAFQHIAAPETIERYVELVARALVQGGVAQFQFDTRARSVAYHVRNLVPDNLLPRDQRLGIRRIRRSPRWLRSRFRSVGLDITSEWYADTSMHSFILQKSVV